MHFCAFSVKLLRLFVPTSATKSAKICNNVSSNFAHSFTANFASKFIQDLQNIMFSHFASVFPQSYPQYIVECRAVQLKTRLIVYSWELLEGCHKLAETMHNSYSVSLYGHTTLLSTIYSLATCFIPPQLLLPAPAFLTSECWETFLHFNSFLDLPPRPPWQPCDWWLAAAPDQWEPGLGSFVMTGV